MVEMTLINRTLINMCISFVHIVVIMLTVAISVKYYRKGMCLCRPYL